MLQAEMVEMQKNEVNFRILVFFDKFMHKPFTL